MPPSNADGHGSRRRQRRPRRFFARVLCPRAVAAAMLVTVACHLRRPRAALPPVHQRRRGHGRRPHHPETWRLQRTRKKAAVESLTVARASPRHGRR